MDASANSSDDHTDRAHVSTTDQEPTRVPALEYVIVRYDSGQDRCTISPTDCSDEEKLTTWLSADLDAFVALDDVR